MDRCRTGRTSREQIVTGWHQEDRPSRSYGNAQYRLKRATQASFPKKSYVYLAPLAEARSLRRGS